jgi:GNAT superfamily N-acetyltransferase
VKDLALHLRGLRTAFAAWEVYAAGVAGASVRRERGYTAAVFPSGPEAAFLNNTVLEPRLSAGRLAAVLDAVEEGYSGIETYAVWVTADDRRTRSFLQERGYVVDTTTAAMALELHGPVAVPRYEPGPATWAAYVEHEGGLLAGVDGSAFSVATALLDGRLVSAALGFEHEADLGIYNVGTHEHARRRGLATALTAYLVNEGVGLGCTTATLQSTPMAERVYAECGFRTVARIVEYVPVSARSDGA